MKLRSADSIYSEILLLSDSEREILIKRINKNYYDDKGIMAFTSSGKPMTKNDYSEQILIGLKQIENGEMLTDDELQKEMRTW